MKGILQKLLQKRGINSVEEMQSEERTTFDSWERILSKDELTIEDVKRFCQSQIDIIDGKWRDLSIPQDKKAEFIPYHAVYRTLLTAMDAPRSAREQLELHLNQLVNQ